MRMRPTIAPLSAALLCLLGGCSGRGDGPELAASQPPDWRLIATEADRGRLRGWRTAWVEALEKARRAGHAAAVAREGALLDPDAALPLEGPPPGDYRCRTIKIGAKSPGLLDYVAYPPFTCRIRAETGLLSFAKMTGSQRPIGMLLADDSNRTIFLGTLQLGDEAEALQYGSDAERDMIGALERVGPRRWRLILPYPHFESTLDVLELVPA